MGALLSLVILLVRSAALSDAMTSKPKGFTIQGKVIWPGEICFLLVPSQHHGMCDPHVVFMSKTVNLKVEVKQILRQEACCDINFHVTIFRVATLTLIVLHVPLCR